MAAATRPTNIPPIRRYARGDRIHVQAQRIWLILTGYVSGRKLSLSSSRLMTYGDLAVRMGYTSRAGLTLGRQLGIVGNYCLMNDLPALNSIVVNVLTDEPGKRVVLSPGMTFNKDMRAVYRQDWYEVGVPTTGTLRKVWEAM